MTLNENQGCPFAKLPPEILYIIGALLTLEQLSALSQTSHHFTNILDPLIYSQLPNHVRPNGKPYNYPCGTTVLDWAAHEGHTSIIERMHRYAPAQAISSESRRRALSFAAKCGHLDTVKCLVDRGAEINTPVAIGWGGLHTALHQAAGCGHKEVAQYLIDVGADVNAPGEIFNYVQGNTVLEYTAKEGNREMIDFLLERGADIKTSGVVRCGIYTGDAEFLRYLLDKGADVNGGRDEAFAPLYWAVSRGNGRGMVEVLVERGIDLSVSGNQMGLHVAAAQGDEETARLLLDHGVDVNCVNDIGETPLHWVAEYPHTDIKEPFSRERVARLLLERGADVWQGNEMGTLPLENAEEWGEEWIIDLLEGEMMKDPEYRRRKEEDEENQ